jgi:hypothetical protein
VSANFMEGKMKVPKIFTSEQLDDAAKRIFLLLCEHDKEHHAHCESPSDCCEVRAAAYLSALLSLFGALGIHSQADYYESEVDA